jgi:hypothetical protein
MIEVRPGLDSLTGSCLIAGAMKNIFLSPFCGGWRFTQAQMFRKNYL